MILGGGTYLVLHFFHTLTMCGVCAGVGAFIVRQDCRLYAPFAIRFKKHGIVCVCMQVSFFSVFALCCSVENCLCLLGYLLRINGDMVHSLCIYGASRLA